jgi:hypothetical protein
MAQAVLCSSSIDNCPAVTNTYNSKIYVSLADGPIQIKYEEAIQTIWSTQRSFLRAALTPTLKTTKVMNMTKNVFTTNTGNDIIATHKAVGVDYERKWLYSTN